MESNLHTLHQNEFQISVVAELPFETGDECPEGMMVFLGKRVPLRFQRSIEFGSLEVVAESTHLADSPEDARAKVKAVSTETVQVFCETAGGHVPMKLIAAHALTVLHVARVPHQHRSGHFMWDLIECLGRPCRVDAFLSDQEIHHSLLMCSADAEALEQSENKGICDIVVTSGIFQSCSMENIGSFVLMKGDTH